MWCKQIFQSMHVLFHELLNICFLRWKMSRKKPDFAFTVLILVGVLNLERMPQSLMKLNTWPVSGSLCCLVGSWMCRVCFLSALLWCSTSRSHSQWTHSLSQTLRGFLFQLPQTRLISFKGVSSITYIPGFFLGWILVVYELMCSSGSYKEVG